jgi:hypothetical protein
MLKVIVLLVGDSSVSHELSPWVLGRYQSAQSKICKRTVVS